MKKIIPIILLLTIVLSLMPQITFASSNDSGKCGENVTYTFDSATGTLTISGSGDMYDWDGPYAMDRFNNLSGRVKQVIIEDGVTSIGEFAFFDCTGMINMDGVEMFSSKEIVSISLPESVKHIGEYAFMGCSKLAEINIPNGVSHIEPRTFENCSNLTKIKIKENNEYYFSDANGLYSKDKTLLIRAIPCDDTYSVPEHVSKIGEYAFGNCENLTSVNIPDSVNSIGYYAFANCTSLVNINISKSISDISYGMFSGCIALTNINLTDNITHIADSAFSRCRGLKSVNIPDSVVSIGDYAFYCCDGLKTIEIPASVISIGKDALDGCTNLESIIVDANNKSYSSDEKVLYNKAKTILIKSISSIKDYTIPNSVKQIFDLAFINCTALANIDIPNSVVSIGNHVFYGCEGLTSISIPNSVENIGNCAFYGCKGLTSINIPNSVVSIGDYAFCGCVGIENITIPDSVETIGERSFDGCRNLISVIIPDSIKNIGAGLFGNCDKLKYVYYYGNNESVITALKEYTNVTLHIEVPIKVVLDGNKIKFDQQPVIENGRTLVPLRAIFEALGATVTWNGETRTVTSTKDGVTIELTIDSNEMKIGDRVKVLDVPAKIVNSRTLVPVRAISEAFGCLVEWEADTRTVIIETL